jgi:PAS domain S-box-containing protein
LQSEAAHASKDDGKPKQGSSTLHRVATAWRSLPDFPGGIGWRLLVRVLVFSSVITLLLTLTQLYLDYRRDVRAIDQRIAEIDSGYRQSLGEGLWRLDVRQLRLQLDGILHLPDIRYVELREATDHTAPLVVTAGSRQANPSVRNEFKIFYTNRGADQLLGILVVEATFDRIYRRLLNTAAVIMVGEAIKTFIVSFFILLIVHLLITRHLTAIAASLRGYDLRGSQAPLHLERHPPRTADELDGLVGAFNQMYARLQVAYGDLQERETKIRRLVDSNIIGICIFDLDGRIMEANEAFLKIVGYGQDDLVADRLRWTALTPPEWSGADEVALAELASTGTCKPFEKEYFRKDNSRVPVLLACAMFGELRHQGVAFVVDLTERKRAEAELRDAERRNLDAQLQLAHVNRIATMGQLTASIAHEINQPIGAILMNASTALRWLNAQPPELERATQSIDRIAADSKRAGEIINRTRDLIKNAPERKESLQVNEAILEVIGLTRSEMLDSDVRVQTRMADDLPPILGDRVQLQQVILNLIMNAIEAMNEISEGKRELLISTSKAEADGVLVAVSDSGPGLPQADPERVFEAFYTTKSSGLGMGLSICRSIIEAHGGRLWATPNEPHGAVFFIMLPIAKVSREGLESSVARKGERD